MSKIKLFINKLSKFQKAICLVLILGLVLFLTIGIPTLARFKNRSTINTISVWNGSVAESYRMGSGTEIDPYIISNGSELAYFAAQLSTNDYDNEYFALSNDIVLNRGIFSYDSENGIQYSIDSQVYYIGNYSNKYYDNLNREGTEAGTVNMFASLNNFKGHFDGKSFRIYGLYIAEQNNEEVALFTGLQGVIHDLYVENAIIYGGIITAGIASTTNNSSLSNILFEGNVIGKNSGISKTDSTTPSASVINLQNTERTDYIDLTNNLPYSSEIVSTSITGNYTLNGVTEAETTIKINGATVTNGSFEIDLGNSILDRIAVLTAISSTTEATLTFSNLSYNITYKYGVSGGISAIGNNTTIENSINKAYIYGYSVGGGLVGATTSPININQCYNIGNINSGHTSGGLIGTIEKSNNNITLLKSYNNGNMTAPNIGGLIGTISNNSGSVSISKAFNTVTNYSIGKIENTTVNVVDSYLVSGGSAVNEGTINGSFTSTSIENLKTKNYIVSNLSYNEFVSFNDLAINNQNVWVYEKDSLPILFVDDISNPVVNIHASIYSWNNLSSELSTIKLHSNITFSIEAADILVPLKENYYYVSNSTNPLTQEELAQISSWTLYSGIVQISEEGSYVVYVKAVDYDDNVTYINTDLLVLDYSCSTVSVELEDNTWSDLRSNLDYVYIDRPQSVTINAVDELSSISSIKYYVTNEVLSVEDLNALSTNSWTSYVNGITIDEFGKHIVYAQVIDSCNYKTYINTDYIILNGYTENDLVIGRNPSSYLGEEAYITNKSSITLNISYTDSSASELNNHTHNIISNILLPLGTKMTLIDNVNQIVYEYKINTSDDIYNYNNSCEVGDIGCKKVATYPLTLFKEVGTGVVDKNFIESTYYDSGVIDEDFTVVLDLSSSNISINYNDVALYMELRNQSNINVRPTLYNTIKKFNIYSVVNNQDTNATLSLATNYSGEGIMYNSNSTTNINITSGIDYEYINGHKIIDTTYEDKELGISIKLVNSQGNIIDKAHLKNIVFKVGDSIYYPEDDNTVRINFNAGINEVTKALTIITCVNNGDLEEGTYYFKISNYASYDGYYNEELSEEEISIPVIVSDNNSKINYSFDVMMNDSNRIINKTSDNVQVSFNILQGGTLDNPNIRISLYKKDQLTAYNQTYSIVNLSNYVSNNLDECENNVYYVSTNPIQYNGTPDSYNNFTLNLITDNFENTGYKFVFDLYDGTKKIGTIEKYFIVK